MDNFKRCNIGISGIAGSGKDTLAAMLIKGLHDRAFTGYKQYSFAKPLKEFTKRVFAMDDHDVYDMSGKEAVFERSYNKHHMRERFNVALLQLLKLVVINDSRTLISEDFKKQSDDYWIRFLDILHDQIVARGVSQTVYEWWKPAGATIYFRTTPRILLQLLGTEFFRDTISESFWTDIAPKNDVVISDMRFPNELDFVQSVNGITIGIVGRNQNTTSSIAHASENVGPVIDKCTYVYSNTGTLENMQEWADDLLDKEFGEV